MEGKEEEMLKCSACMTPIPEGATECPDCGEPVAGKEEVETVTCSTCGKKSPVGTKFCPECGEGLEEEKEKKEVPEKEEKKGFKLNLISIFGLLITVLGIIGAVADGIIKANGPRPCLGIHNPQGVYGPIFSMVLAISVVIMLFGIITFFIGYRMSKRK